MQKTIKLFGTICILVSIIILAFSATSNIVSAAAIIPGPSHPKADLKIITSVINKCVPKTICNAVRPDSFHIDVFALGNSSTNWKYELLGQGFPGSPAGWTIDLVPGSEGIQYKVIQYRPFSPMIDSLGLIANTSYSDNCLGTIINGENKTCTISNVVTNPQAYLKIITSVINHCVPKAVCDVIGPDNFRTDITGIVVNNKEGIKYVPLGPILPGSLMGWVLHLFPGPDGLQYHVRQNPIVVQEGYPPINNLRSAVVHSNNCHGFLYQEDNRLCVISNTLTNTNSVSANSTARSMH
jgi:ferredoxin